MTALAPTTLEQTLAPRKEPGGWLELVAAPGEAHRVRGELMEPGTSAVALPLRPCAALVQVTDPQLCDPVSPGRMDFLRGRQIPTAAGPRPLYTVYRPSELLAPHAYAGLLEAIARRPEGPVTGLPLALAVLTGDFADNAQLNELRWARQLLGGGAFDRALDPDELARVAAAGASAGWAYDPERAGEDAWQRDWGHPHLPGLLAKAAQPFTSPGLKLPAVVLAGNHDLLVQGVAPPSDAYRQLATGDRKIVDLASEPPTREQLQHDPVVSGTTETVAVAPDSERLPVARADFERIIGGGAPGARTQLGPIELLALDTWSPTGGADGIFTRVQAAWLEQRLRACSAAHGGEDRLVLVATHHSSTTLSAEGPEQLPELLLRFPNVVAWLNGHTHVHSVRPHRDLYWRAPGFWEITTASVADWPCQARLLELALTADGHVALYSTLLDGADANDDDELAALHRVLALNFCAPSEWAGGSGTHDDRNVVLLWRASDPLRAALSSATPPFVPTDQQQRFV